MAALRSIVSSRALGAARCTPATFTVAKRGYAEAASPAGDKLRLSLVLPHEVRNHLSTRYIALGVDKLGSRL